MSRFAPFFLWSLLRLAPVAHAQIAPPSIPTTATPDALQRDLTQMAAWYGRGFYDDVVHRADELIGDQNAPDTRVPDARLLFWRGKAFQRLGWLLEAIEPF